MKSFDYKPFRRLTGKGYYFSAKGKTTCPAQQNN
jgi:hypothetical protein